MVRVLFSALLLAATVVGAADFNVSSDTSSTLRNSSGSETHNYFSALMDDSLDTHWHFVWGVEYERYDLNKSSPRLPEVLQSIGAHLGWEYREGEDPLLMLQLQPGWHGGKNMRDGGFDCPVTLGSGYPVADNLDAAFGVYYARFATYQWLPVGGLVWKPAKEWELDLLFPNSTLTWTVNETDSVVAFLEELGTGYQIHDANDRSLRLEYYQTKAGFLWEHEFKPGWSTSLQAGWAFGRTMDFYEQNRTVTSPSTPFVALGLKARF